MLFIGFGIVLASILIIFGNNSLYSFSTVFILIVGLSYSICNIQEHFALFSFNVGFAIFLILGYVISLVQIGDFSYFSNDYFSPSLKAIEHTCFSCFISIIIVNLSYIVFFKKKKKKSFKIIKPNKILVALLIISYLCNIIELSESAILVHKVSYYYSGNYMSNLPSIIIHIASLFYISLFLIWGLFPRKKVIYVTLILLIPLLILQLYSGKRGEAISLVMTVFFYITLRNKNGIKDIVISKKIVIIIVALLPFVIYLMQEISYTRENIKYNSSVFKGIEEFFEAQGTSVKIIANSYDLYDEIVELGGNNFVLGEIRDYLKNNIVTRLLLNKEKRVRNIEDVYSGDNFLRTYGYAYSPVIYKNNVGSGSAYIAEVYHDGGYLLLIFANILIGFLLIKVESVNESSALKTAIKLNIFRYMPLLPRGMFLGWFLNTFSVQNLLMFLLIIIVSNKKK